MAKTETFQCTVVTPERPVLDVPATFVAFPAHDGEMGVLVNRAPLVAKLGAGPLRVESGEQKHVLFIDGGFAQMVDNRLTILTEQAKTAGEIDVSAATRALAEAQSAPAASEAAVLERARAVKRAKSQIQIAKSHRP